MVCGKRSLGSFFSLLALASACSSSSNDDSAATTGTGGAGANSSAGHAGANYPDAGSGGASHAGSSSGGTHAGGTHAGDPHGGGNGGSSAGAANAGANVGGNGGEAGAAEPGGTDSGGAPDEAGSANAGASGEAGSNTRTTAYIAGFLGGIYTYSVDLASGAPTATVAIPIDQHAFINAIAVAPSQRFLYVADQRGTLDTFAIATDGSLPPTPKFSTPIAGHPQTFALDAAGRFAYVGSAGTPSLITVLSLDPDTGQPAASGAPITLDSPPAYFTLSPNGQFAYLSGLTKVGLWAYRVNQTNGALELLDGAPFGGDTVFKGALAFTPNGSFLYTTGSGLTNTGAGLNGFRIAQDGTPVRIGADLFSSDEFSDPSARNIALDGSGKYLYVGEFLNDERVFQFSIDGATGKPTPLAVPALKTMDPYSCALDPSGRFLYFGLDVGSVAVFERDLTTGALHEIDGSPFSPSLPEPVIAFSTHSTVP